MVRNKGHSPLKDLRSDWGSKRVSVFVSFGSSERCGSRRSDCSAIWLPSSGVGVGRERIGVLCPTLEFTAEAASPLGRYFTKSLRIIVLKVKNLLCKAKLIINSDRTQIRHH